MTDTHEKKTLKLDVEIDPVKFAIFSGPERYWAFDVDGSRAGTIGNSAGSWQKKAIGLRICERSGYGLWDKETNEVVLKPDAERRRRDLETAQRIAEDKLTTTKEKLAVIRKAELYDKLGPKEHETWGPELDGAARRQEKRGQDNTRSTHDFPLTAIEERNGKQWYRCERCGRQFSEATPTCYPGCCKEGSA